MTARRSRSTPGTSSARTASRRGWPARSAHRSTRHAGGRRAPVRLLRRHSVDGIELFVGERVRRRVPDPPRAGLHLGLHAVRRRQAARRRTGSRAEAFGELLHRAPPRSWPRAAPARAGPRRCRACCASPTRSARRSARAGRWSAMPATTVTPSPRTASATRSATPSSWPSRLTGPARRRRGRDRGPRVLSAAARPGAAGDLRDHLPPGRLSGRPAFIELQKQLSAAIETRRRRWPPGRYPGERLCRRLICHSTVRRPLPDIQESPTARTTTTPRRTNMTTTETSRPDAQRRGHRDPVRHPRRGQAAPEAANSSSAPATNGSAAPTTAPPSPATSVSARSAPTSAGSSSTRTTPPSWSARTTGRPRPSSCCTRWPPASPPAWPTSPPPAGSG